MITEAYLKRLADWVSQERNRWGSLSRLRSRLERASGEMLSEETLRKWAEGRVGKEGLRGKSLLILAAYRGETVEQVRAWLEGADGDFSTPDYSTARTFVEVGPLSEVAAIAQIATHRLSSELSKSPLPAGTPVMCDSLKFLILKAFEKRGLDPYNPEHLQIFYELPGRVMDDPIRRAKLLILIQEGQNTFGSKDLPYLALALQLFSGDTPEEQDDWYTVAHLEEFIKNPPPEVRDCCPEQTGTEVRR